ncbi:tumor necrosis factor receptor superfamily member 11B-like [Tachysurus ichikawai]
MNEVQMFVQCCAAQNQGEFFFVSFAWAYHETPRYQHRDPLTLELLLCDQCPPGSAVEHHCTSDSATVCSPCPERRFAEQWHWGESCQHCTPVCKERQIVKRECNATHNRVCECVSGYHLAVEFCVPHSPCAPGSGVSVLAFTALTAEPRLHQTSVRSGDPTCPYEEQNRHLNADGKVTELHSLCSVHAVCSGIEVALGAQGGGEGKCFRSRNVLILLRAQNV